MATFNRVQENLIRGGLQGVNRNGNCTTTRAISSIPESLRLNRALWNLAHARANAA